MKIIKRILLSLYHRAKALYAYLINAFWFKFCANTEPLPQKDYTNEPFWQELLSFLATNKDVEYTFRKIDVGGEGDYKWVGGVFHNNIGYGIPSGHTKMLKIDLATEEVSEFGNLSQGKFKWSGGCYYKKAIYGFPRTSNCLLKYDLEKDSFEEIDLGFGFTKEHHYGGVCTEDGIVYQPPRSNNTIMKIDLNTMVATEIPISRYKKFRYCGSLIHPNGLIYMFPEKNHKVLVLDPKTDKISFIGGLVSTMAFGATVSIDGTIYGFSAYGTGFLKIDVKNNEVKILSKNAKFSCYSGIGAVFGGIMGTPGDGEAILKYDFTTAKIEKIQKLEEQGKAKCAGTVVSQNGNIYQIPALGRYIYVLSPKLRKPIPQKLLESAYFNNNY